MVVKKGKKTYLVDTDGVEYRKVRTDRIEIDPRFSRRTDWSKHERMQTAFRRRLAGTLICVYYEGRLLCVDGAARLKKLRGTQAEVVVQVVRGLSDEEIHELFVAANVRRTRVTGFDKFRHLYWANNHTQVTIVARARAYGFRVPIGLKEPRTVNAIYAYDTMTWIFEKFGQSTLEGVFCVIQKYFLVNPVIRHIEPAARKGEFLEALAMVLAEKHGCDPFVQALIQADATAAEIAAEARERARQVGQSGLKARTWFTYQTLLDVRDHEPWKRVTV